MVNQCRVVEQLSQAMPPSFVWELALVECPVAMDLVWMVMTRYCRVGYYSFSFLCGFGVTLGDDRSHMGGSDDMESVFMYWWCMCGILRTHICFCVFTLFTTFWDLFNVVLSCNRTQCRGLGTYSCLYILYV